MHKKYFKKYYFIEKFEKSNIDKLKKYTGIIYRNYKRNYKVSEIILLRDYCRRKGIKFFLSNNIKLSVNLDLDGAYIPSFNQSLRHLAYKTKSSFVIMGSAHNIREIRQKEAQKVKFIFISSIFKKNKNYLGLYKFIKLAKSTKTDVVALGGISVKNIKKLSLTTAYGFAGIDYFS